MSLRNSPKPGSGQCYHIRLGRAAICDDAIAEWDYLGLWRFYLSDEAFNAGVDVGICGNL